MDHKLHERYLKSSSDSIQELYGLSECNSNLNSRILKSSIDHTKDRYKKFDSRGESNNNNKNIYTQDLLDNTITIKEIETDRERPTDSTKKEPSESVKDSLVNKTNLSQGLPHNTTNSTDANYNFMKSEINRLQSKVNYLMKDKKKEFKNNEIKIKNDEEYTSNKSSNNNTHNNLNPNAFYNNINNNKNITKTSNLFNNLNNINNINNQSSKAKSNTNSNSNNNDNKSNNRQDRQDNTPQQTHTDYNNFNTLKSEIDSLQTNIDGLENQLFAKDKKSNILPEKSEYKNNKLNTIDYQKSKYLANREARDDRDDRNISNKLRTIDNNQINHFAQNKVNNTNSNYYQEKSIKATSKVPSKILSKATSNDGYESYKPHSNFLKNEQLKNNYINNNEDENDEANNEDENNEENIDENYDNNEENNENIEEENNENTEDDNITPNQLYKNFSNNYHNKEKSITSNDREKFNKPNSKEHSIKTYHENKPQNNMSNIKSNKSNTNSIIPEYAKSTKNNPSPSYNSNSNIYSNTKVIPNRAYSPENNYKNETNSNENNFNRDKPVEHAINNLCDLTKEILLKKRTTPSKYDYKSNDYYSGYNPFVEPKSKYLEQEREMRELKELKDRNVNVGVNNYKDTDKENYGYNEEEDEIKSPKDNINNVNRRGENYSQTKFSDKDNNSRFNNNTIDYKNDRDGRDARNEWMEKYMTLNSDYHLLKNELVQEKLKNQNLTKELEIKDTKINDIGDMQARYDSLYETYKDIKMKFEKSEILRHEHCKNIEVLHRELKEYKGYRGTEYKEIRITDNNKTEPRKKINSTPKNKKVTSTPRKKTNKVVDKKFTKK